MVVAQVADEKYLEKSTDLTTPSSEPHIFTMKISTDISHDYFSDLHKRVQEQSRHHKTLISQPV